MNFLARPAALGAAVLAALLAAGPASAASWTVDTAHSKLGFTGSQSGAAFSGQFSRWDAAIDFDPANPTAGHATVTIDMASAKTGDVQKDQSLPEADWFSTKAFPKAVFEATSFKSVGPAKGGGNQYEAVGTLTIRGIKKDVVLPFTLDVAGGKAHAVGKLDLVRTDYGVGQGAWSTGQMVALNVSVVVDLTATTK